MDDVMKDAVAKVVAAKIVEALDGPSRDAILSEGVRHALDFDVKHACRKLVEARAAKIAAELIETGKYDEMMRDAIKKEFDNMISLLPEAIREALMAALFGRKGKDSYSHYAGLALDIYKSKQGG